MKFSINLKNARSKDCCFYAYRKMQELVAGIINETVDPREVFSLRGILRSFVS